MAGPVVTGAALVASRPGLLLSLLILLIASLVLLIALLVLLIALLLLVTLVRVALLVLALFVRIALLACSVRARGLLSAVLASRSACLRWTGFWSLGLRRAALTVLILVRRFGARLGGRLRRG